MALASRIGVVKKDIKPASEEGDRASQTGKARSLNGGSYAHAGVPYAADPNSHQYPAAVVKAFGDKFHTFPRVSGTVVSTHYAHIFPYTSHWVAMLDRLQLYTGGVA